MQKHWKLFYQYLLNNMKNSNSKMRLQEVIILLLFVNITKSEHSHKEASKSKNPLPYFRRQVEGLPEGSTIGTFTDDLSSNLVSFLVKNAKQIFGDINDEAGVSKLSTCRTTTDDFKPTKLLFKEETTLTPATMTYENLSLTTLIDHNLVQPLLDKDDVEMNLRTELMHLTKQLKTYEKSEPILITRGDLVSTSISSYVLETTESTGGNDPKRSCIFCNNIESENCIDPKNKLIPSVTCERDGDLCYSQHTPFGIIDRGCFNVNHNLTTYVCSCNLCNYISISEMPYIYSNKQDWAENVIELSRTRSLRKSVFKDMSCLRCEVNTTTKTGDMLNSANCLEGNIGYLPIQDCDENEICGVKAVRSHGYIWRGCVQAPLYNYWWALCDTDLCNYDNMVTIYDFVEEK